MTAIKSSPVSASDHVDERTLLRFRAKLDPWFSPDKIDRLRSWRIRSLVLLSYVYRHAAWLRDSYVRSRGSKPTLTKATPTNTVRTKAAPRFQAAALDLKSPEVQCISKSLIDESQTARSTANLLLLSGLTFVAGAAPWLLPPLFVVFFAVALPWRIMEFVKRKYTFYLVDFCYFANTATVIYLVLLPSSVNMRAMVYALAEGPLAAALIPWECAWVMTSFDHVVSVLIHLLPGLAMFAHHHLSPLRGWRDYVEAVRDPSQVAPTTPEFVDRPWTWLLFAPLLFYMAWQLVYFLIVQVWWRATILRENYDTSYRCMAKRSAAANSPWHDFVRRGTPLQRCVQFGLVQLGFTLVALAWAPFGYYSRTVAAVWQVAKFVVPLYHGSRFTARRTPQVVWSEGLQRLDALVQKQADAGPQAGHKALVLRQAAARKLPEA